MDSPVVVSLIAAGIDRVIALAVIITAGLIASGLMGQAFAPAPEALEERRG